MKKVLNLIILCLIFVSCENEISSDVDLSFYENIGELHNDGLDYVFEELNKKKFSHLKSSSDLITKEEIIKLTVDFLKF